MTRRFAGFAAALSFLLAPYAFAQDVAQEMSHDMTMDMGGEDHDMMHEMMHGTDNGDFGPFDVEAWGVYSELVETRRYTTNFFLHGLPYYDITVAVGALTGLRGEVTVIDKEVIISYGGGSCADCPPKSEEETTLLATASVSRWSDPIALPGTLSGPDLEKFILDQATMMGLAAGEPFPFRLQGTLVKAGMHVAKGPNPAFTGHGSTQTMAVMDVVESAAIGGEVIGFHSGEKLEGVISHPGERFHFHFVNAAHTATAHIDSFGMAQGSQLRLPLPPPSR